ncbi:MAG: CpsD/CapB family tyrosine-protein kinase [Parvularculaceae bacterium]|jgi:Mrp family chromosome partitioning ATPase|nr:CpsD/CapB family tyrosine-protein kinase [Parvularculaceae bacterium]
MDRIREAVTRARSAQPKAGETIAKTGGAVRFQSSSPIDPGAFKEVRCDFEKFPAHRIISNEQDPVLASYRILRTRVLQKMEAEGLKTLAIVSPNSGAGKTVTAINLAIAIASKSGTRVMLVDLDFYRPSIARYLGVQDAPSILDFFEGKMSLQDVTVRPDLPDMLLAANERVSRRGAGHLTSPKADELLDRGVKEFGAQIMIFDLSPILGCDDSIAFLPKVDCALMIAASGNTRESDLRDAMRLVGKTKLIGTVLNKAPAGSLTPTYYY